MPQKPPGATVTNSERWSSDKGAAGAATLSGRNRTSAVVSDAVGSGEAAGREASCSFEQEASTPTSTNDVVADAVVSDHPIGAQSPAGACGPAGVQK